MEGTTIPHDLTSLKRPALQRLCKKIGIKANKKNVDLVKALEELRDSARPIDHNKISFNKISSVEERKSQSHTLLPSPDSHHDIESSSKTRLSLEDKKGDSDTANCGSDFKSKYSIDVHSQITCHSGDTPLSLSGVSHTSSEPWLTISTESPYSSKPHDHEFTCSPISDNVEMSLPQKTEYSNTPTNEPHTPVCKNAFSPYPSCECAVEITENNLTLPDCNEAAPFSPPVGNQECQSGSKRKRNPTYTLETISNENEPDECQYEKPPLKRLRRETFSVSPKITNMQETVVISANDNGIITGTEAETLSGIADVHSEIMNLLDKRVEKKLTDLNHEPVLSSSELLSKNLPKTSTVKKFDSAHKKHFSRMRSIVSYQREKEKRNSSAKSQNCTRAAKRPKLTEQQPAIRSKIPKATFKPSVLNVKHTSFNFTDKNTMTKPANPDNESSHKLAENKSRKSTAVLKTPGKSASNNSKTFVFNAKSATSAKKAQFDLSKSLKKKPTYRPHAGKLPDFNISRY